MNSKSVAIIGGGIAGLTAAFLLKKSGWTVTLLETSERVGGAIATYQEGSYLAELGPNTILENSPKVTALVSALGLDDEKIYAPTAAKRYILKKGRPTPLPMSPPSFFLSPFFSWRAKLKLLREPFVAPAPKDWEESLSQFVLRRLGPEFLDYAVDPFVAGVYAGDPDRLSVKYGFRKLYNLEQDYGSLIKGQLRGRRKMTAKLFSFRDGLRRLPEKLQEYLKDSIILHATVTEVHRDGNEWSLTYDKKGLSEKIRAGHVIFAGQGYNLPRFQLAGEDLSVFRELVYAPVAAVTLGFKREELGHPLDGFGMLVPKLEGRKILGVLFSSSLFPGRAPAGYVTLTVFVGGMRAPALTFLPEDKQLALILSDLKVPLDLKGRPSFVHRAVWEKAIPQYEVGYGRFLDRLNALEAKYPGLHFAGNYRAGISVPDTLSHAATLAEKMKILATYS